MTFPRLHTLIALAALLTAACSHDEIVDEQPTQLLQMVTSSVSTLQSPVATRALSHAPGDPAETFVPGTGSGDDVDGVPTFQPYNSLYPVPINREFTTVGTFLAEDKYSTYSSISGYFRYDKDNHWTSTVGIKADTHNYIFGYMPSNTGTVQATITKLPDDDPGDDVPPTWAKGAKMSLRNLPAATPADVCIVVGVLKAEVPNSKPVDWSPKPITDADVVRVLRQGQYYYPGTESDNYVYLLLEHIYANINVELQVDPQYAELRNIVLKDVFVRVKLPSQVNCDLELCNDPKNPIKDIKFSNGSGAESVTRARLFTSDDRMLLSTSPQSVPVYFSPYLPSEGFDYEFHYDVYDKKGIDATHPYGNLVRENCVAINHWSIHGYSVEAGKSFKATVTVKPTYLFMLSEPDLDNPSFELKVEPAPKNRTP